MNIIIAVDPSEVNEIKDEGLSRYQKALVVAVRKSAKKLDELRLNFGASRLVFIKCVDPKNLKFRFFAS